MGKDFTFHGKVSSPSISRNRSRVIYVDKIRALQPKRWEPFMTRLPLPNSYNLPQEQHWVKFSPSTEKFLHHPLVLIEVG